MKKIFISSVILVALLGCASASKVSDVLEPLDENEKPAESTAARPPAYEKAMNQLSSLGYEGVGLNYEEEAGLELLFQAFSNPAVAERRIRLVYTGIAMAYDASHESLTVGGENDPLKVVAYIQKNIPLRSEPPAAQQPAVIKEEPKPVKKAAPHSKTPPKTLKTKSKKIIKPKPKPIEKTKVLPDTSATDETPAPIENTPE